MPNLFRTAVLRGGSAGGGGGPPLGLELVINGGFVDATGWTLVGATVSTGRLVCSGGGTTSASRTAASTLTPGTYQVELDVVSTNGVAELQVRVGGTAKDIPDSVTPDHYIDTVVVTAVTDQFVAFYAFDTNCQIDNFSVKRIA